MPNAAMAADIEECADFARFVTGKQDRKAAQIAPQEGTGAIQLARMGKGVWVRAEHLVALGSEALLAGVVLDRYLHRTIIEKRRF